jgi:hypothetical protein
MYSYVECLLKEGKKHGREKGMAEKKKQDEVLTTTFTDLQTRRSCFPMGHCKGIKLTRWSKERKCLAGQQNRQI